MKGGGDFGRAFGGISSLELGPRAVWTQADERGFGLADLCRWMAEQPAALAGLARPGPDRGRVSGRICAHSIPTHVQTVHAGSLHHRHAVTPVRRCRTARLGDADVAGGAPRLRAGGPAGMRILVLNPNTSESMTAEIAAAAAAAAAGAPRSSPGNPRFGATAIDSAAESYLSAVGVMDLVATMLAAGEFDYDAVDSRRVR